LWIDDVTTDENGRASDARRVKRIAISTPADLREAGGGARYRVAMLDVSVAGFRFECSSSIDPGVRCFLTLPGMAGLECLVAWRRGWIYGARFVNPLYPAVCDHIAAKYPCR